MSKLLVVLFCIGFAFAGAVLAQDAVPAAAPAPDAAPAAAPAAPAAAPVVVAPPAAPVAPTEFTRTGTILVVKDASGKTTIKLIQLAYDLVVDDANKAIADLDGKRVRVKGSFVETSGKKNFSVKSFEPVDVPAPAAAPAAPAPAAPAAP